MEEKNNIETPPVNIEQEVIKPEDETINSVQELDLRKTYPTPVVNMVDIMRRKGQAELDTYKLHQSMGPGTATATPQIGKVGDYAGATKGKVESNPILRQLAEDNGKQKWERKANAKRSDVFDKLNSGAEVARYEEFYDNRDNNEYYATRQGTGEVWQRGLTKFLGKTLVGVAGNIVGTAVGGVEALVTGNADALYDNSFLRFTDDLNTKMDNRLAHYYSESERALSLAGSTATSRFWADKVLGGAQFTASTILSEAFLTWATGGTSLASTGARAGLRMAGATPTKILKMNALARKASKMNTLETMAKKARLTNSEYSFAKMGYQAGKMAGNARYMLQTAAYESGFETRMFEKEMKELFSEKYPDATIEEISEFNKNMQVASDFVYRSNMLIVGSSNMFGPMAKVLGRSSSPSFSGNIVSRNLLGAGGKTVDGKFIASTAKTWQKSLRSPAFLLKSSVPEMLEEGGQGLTTLGAEKWLFKSMTDENIRTMSDLLKGTLDSAGEYMGTREGQEEMLIGAIIGALMGSGHSIVKGNKLSGDYGAIEKKAKALELFTEEGGERSKIIEHLIYGNQQLTHMQSFEDAVANGDFLRANQAVDDAILTSLNRAKGFEYLEQTIEETRAVLKSTEISKVMEAYQLKEGEEWMAREIIDNSVKQFDALAESYTRNNKLVEQYFGDKLTKEEMEIFAIPDNNSSMENMKSMLTYALVKGERAYEELSEAGNEIMAEYAKVYGRTNLGSLELLQELDKEGVRKEGIKKGLVEEYKKLEEELKAKEEARRKQITTKEVNLSEETTRTNEMETIAEEILDIQKRQDAILKEINAFEEISKVGAKVNPFSQKDERTYVTKEDLENIGKVIENLQKLTEELNDGDNLEQYKYDRLARAFEDYHRSLSSFKAHDTIVKEMRAGKLQLTGAKGLIGKVTKRGVNEETERFLKALLEDYGVQVEYTKEATVQRAAEEKYVEELDSEGKPIKKESDVTRFRPRPKHVEQSKPTNLREVIKEVVEKSSYAKLRDVNVDNILPVDSEALTELINNLFDNPENVTDEQQLLIRTILGENGISLEDLMTQEKQKQGRNPKENDFSQGVEETDFDNLIEESDSVSYSNSVNVGVRDSRVLQTTSQVFVKGTGENEVTIYHLTPEGLMEAFGVTGDVELIDSNDRAIPVPADQLNAYRKPGVKLKGIKFTVGGKEYFASLDSANGNIKMEPRQAEELFNANGMTIYKSAATTTNKYLMVYKGRKPMDSDFNQGSNGLAYTHQDIYDVVPGDKVTFKVDPKDPWNVRLRNMYEAMKASKLTKKERKELLEELRNSVKIQVYDSKGNLVSDLKANKETSNTTPEFEKIRELGFEAFMQMGDTEVDLGATVEVEHIFLGLPVLEIDQGKVTENSIDPNDVVDVGYYTKGGLKTKGGTQNVNTDLVKRLRKKTVPIVVVRHGKQLIAFPVSMSEKESTFRAETIEALERGSNPAQEVIKIQEKLKKVGLDPKEYGLEYANEEINTIKDPNSETGYSERLEKAFSDIAERDNRHDFKEWVNKDFDVADIADQAKISVDLKSDFMTSPKIVLGYGTAKFGTKGGSTKTGVNTVATSTKNSLKKATKAADLFNQMKKMAKRGSTIQTNMQKWKPKGGVTPEGFTVIEVDRKKVLVMNHKSLPKRVLLNFNKAAELHVAEYLITLASIESEGGSNKVKSDKKKKAVADFMNKGFKGTLLREMEKGEKVNDLLKETQSKEYTRYYEEAKKVKEEINKVGEELAKELADMDIELDSAQEGYLQMAVDFSEYTEELIKRFDKC